jgi:hypothetical protein
MKKLLGIMCAITLLYSCGDDGKKKSSSASTAWQLSVSSNGRFLVKSDGTPFFWLGDTAWLIFNKMTRSDVETYMADRQSRGFNVVQVSLLHPTLPIKSVYGALSIEGTDISKPIVTAGNDPNDSAQYDYWDHVDYVVDTAAKYGIYLAMVPVWGTSVQNNLVSADQATSYAKFLAARYKDKSNVIWLVGGDIRGDVHNEVWEALGTTLRANDPNHMITYHPRGRFTSSQWFHNDSWLDFDMFQSGHRTYAQDIDATDRNYGEDSWRYVAEDFAHTPAKPTIDGEPSYENIPKGLTKNTDGTRWDENDVRRYAYWSVFAGSFGHTYGHNSIMQCYSSSDTSGSYSPTMYWTEALSAKGASQLQYLKSLILSRDVLSRVPDASMVNDQGTKYDYISATRGTGYAFFYTYTGRTFSLNMGIISGTNVKATWYSPRDGSTQSLGTIANTGVVSFDPPDSPANGNDWVLILDSAN